MLLGSGGSIGSQGSSDERSFSSFIPTGDIVVGSGAATANAPTFEILGDHRSYGVTVSKTF